jgi:spermidine/putrescine transport system substrate-binding protein
MLIPKGAQHKYTAELMIDFVYDPAIAAQIAAYVNYDAGQGSQAKSSPRPTRTWPATC